MITLDANNRLLTLIRALPALDAFADALDNQLTVFTQHDDLFLGRPYRATDRPVDVDHSLVRRDDPPRHNPLPEIYDELAAVAALYGKTLRPVAAVPRLGVAWDPERLYCVDNAYLTNPVVAVIQRRPGPLTPPASTLARILRGVAARTRLLHVLLDGDAPAVPGAVEVALRLPGGAYAQPPLGGVMRAVSAARAVVTNAWWAHDLAVGYRKPVAFLLPAAFPYGRPYGDRLTAKFGPGALEGLAAVEVVRGGGCLLAGPDCRGGLECRADPPGRCAGAMDPEAALARIERIL